MCNLNEGVYEDGMKKGIQEGRQEGRQEGKLSVIKKMLEKGLPHSVISDCSGLSISEIEKIAAQA